jgi:hypothetical protein
MTTDTVLQNLQINYSSMQSAILNMEEVLKKAKKAAFEYEVFLSDQEYKQGKGIVIDDIEKYFEDLISKNENS